MKIPYYVASVNRDRKVRTTLKTDRGAIITNSAYVGTFNMNSCCDLLTL